MSVDEFNSQGGKIIIVEDHPTLAVLLGNYINQLDEFSVMGEFGSGEAALDYLQNEPVDLVLLDLGLPGQSGLEVIADIRNNWPETKILVFTAQINPRPLLQAVRMGVSCIMEKTVPFEQLGTALRDVMQGKTFFCSQTNSLFRDVVRTGEWAKTIKAKELTILRMCKNGMNTKQIADEIGMSIPGVYKALERLRAKTGAKSNTDLAITYAREIFPK